MSDYDKRGNELVTSRPKSSTSASTKFIEDAAPVTGHHAEAFVNTDSGVEDERKPSGKTREGWNVGAYIVAGAATFSLVVNLALFTDFVVRNDPTESSHD